MELSDERMTDWVESDGEDATGFGVRMKMMVSMGLKCVRFDGVGRGSGLRVVI